MKAAILYQKVHDKSAADELDVLVQKDEIARVLQELGHDVIDVPVTLNLEMLKSILLDAKPHFVFNLVESIDGSGQILHFVPALLEHLAIPFTGAGADSMYLSTNKILAKERLQSFGIATPPWGVNERPGFGGPYIVKPVSEDASVDIDEDMVVSDVEELSSLLAKKQKGGRFFIEQFIAGREFNLALLASSDGPQVLPTAEIVFEDYPPEKPHIVGYKAKWQEDSFEFNHTVRRFQYPPKDDALLEKLKEAALLCWHAFQLRGYARVDFRVDKEGRPWVLEINANPCISPDSGFVAAAEKAGLSFTSIVQRIIADLY